MAFARIAEFIQVKQGLAHRVVVGRSAFDAFDLFDRLFERKLYRW
jgi:hypothetical protein